MNYTIKKAIFIRFSIELEKQIIYNVSGTLFLNHIGQRFLFKNF